MNRRELVVVGCLAWAWPFGCRRASISSSGGAADAGEPSSASASVAATKLRGPRCGGPDGAIALEAVGDDLEIGDAIAYGEGYAVGLVRGTSAGRIASVALLGPDASRLLRRIDLGPTLADGPPPRLAWRSGDKGGKLVAGVYAKPQPGSEEAGVWPLALHVLDETPPVPTVLVPQQRDDSFAFDLALSGSNALVVWDEVRQSRGVVRVAAWSPDESPGPARDLSPPDTDAELPRIVPLGAGFLGLWIARKPDRVDPAEASDLESTGEERAYGWIEAVVVDARGEVAGAVRRLTSTTGHVSAFDVQKLPGAGKPLLVIVARDDGEAVDGSGGTLLRARITADTAELSGAFATDGLGRGGPAFVSGDAPWLTWVGPHEQLRLLPLDAAGAPVGAASAEEALNDARPLLLLPRGRVLVATPSDRVAQLRTVVCER